MARPKIDFRTASKENYERFCKEHPNTKITFKEFQSIIYHWNESLMTSILETGDKVKLPYGFGYISINKKETQRYFVDKEGTKHCILPVDWQKTREEGKKVYILNNHTEGYRFKWFWFKEEARLTQTEIWCFKPAKKFSLLLAKYLTLKRDKNYVEVYKMWYKGKTRV